MGLFNYVNFETVCPVCHKKVTDFQTKDSIRLLETVEPRAVDNFYSYCDICGVWVEYFRTSPEHFERKIEGKYGFIDKHTKKIKIV